MHEILIFTGGNSIERECSLRSYENIVSQILSSKYIISGVLFEGEYFYYSSGYQPKSWIDLKDSAARPISELACIIDRDKHFIINLLCGGRGEDGSLDGMAAFYGWKGTFSEPAASALAMLKPALSSWVEKEYINKVIPLPTLSFGCSQLELDAFLEKHHSCGFVIKPVASGSSIGVKLFYDLDIPIIQTHSRQLDHNSIIQKRIMGKEYTVGIIRRRDGFQALPVIRMDTLIDFVSDEAKRGEKPIILTQVENDITRNLQDLSISITKQLNMGFLTRMDWIVNEEGPHFLEANTVPGLTVKSPYTEMMKAANLSWTLLIEEWINLINPSQTNIFESL